MSDRLPVLVDMSEAEGEWWEAVTCPDCVPYCIGWLELCDRCANE